ncbi:MAG: ABC transporter permease, partial [Blastocatellia bacterium]|nr:ABC transporter permease [Blastocatellia bacterium]
IAVLTLGLGIGINTAVFAGFNLLMRPTQIKDPATVVKIERQGEEDNRDFSFAEYSYFRDHTQTLSELIPTSEEMLLFDEAKIKGIFTSSNFLSALGGTMQLGSYFTDGQDAVVVLSYYFWRQHFAEDQAILGRTLLLNGKPFTVIGVTAPKFVGLQTEMPDIWLPLAARENQDGQWLSLHARLKPGNTAADAQAELARLHSQAGAVADEKFIGVETAFRMGGKESLRVTMAIVLGASGLVLLIACSNIANMLLARAAARQKEIGVRMAIGASRWRLIRQLLTESFLLAIVGGATGLLFARWGIQMLFPWVIARSDGRDFERTAISLSLDWRVLLFAISLSLLSGIAFGLVPALRATRPDLVAVIKEENTAFGGRLARSWLGNGLVIAQVALSFTLLIPAGLLLRALTKVLSIDRGYEANNLLIVEYMLPAAVPYHPDARTFQRQLMSRLVKLPGALAVSPMHEFGGFVRIVTEHDKANIDQVPFYRVTAGYFNTTGITIVLGRGFTAEEEAHKVPVIIVSQSTAHNLWPADNPLGKTMHIEQRLPDGSMQVIMPNAKVIGVAQDNQVYRAGHIPPLFFYAPQPQSILELYQLLVRTEREPASMKEAVRAETTGMDSRLVVNVGRAETILGESSSINTTRIASELATTLGSLALLLAALGLYGVMGFAVAQRTREIGIRIALGAQSWHVQSLVVAQGMRLVTLGIVIGVPLSLMSSQLMKSMLFGLRTTDSITYLGVVVLLALAGLLACWLPALRATKVSPTAVLRDE